LPTLQDSCHRFLAWCTPLLTDEELEATRAGVAAFLSPDSPAHQLQAALEQYDAADGVRSWLDAFWSDRYLGRRDRIALNANFFYLFEDSGQGQVERAATLLAGAVTYKLHLDAGRIPPVMQRGRALSTEQNQFLFSATRIPGAPRDSIRAPYSQDWPGPSRERHIVVFHRGHLFRMDVIDPHGRPYAVPDLADGLRAVMTGAEVRGTPSAPVGHLTTKARGEWAESRRALLDCHPDNARLLDTVETALLCLCLDDAVLKDAAAACDHLLHGDSANRWYDKALSLVVFPDGTAGVNVEHSRLDGTTIATFVDTLLAQSTEQHAHESLGAPPHDLIEFILDSDLAAEVRDSAAGFAAAAADTATTVLSFRGFGATRIKQLRMSPDAFLQLAFQLAHRRTRGFVGATYESIGTRQFRHGRTEAMRVVTPEILRFVATMDDPSADDATRRATFRAAAEKHVQRAKECQAGHAPEQHLWELQLSHTRRTKALGKPLPLYETPGWLKMRDDYLSTSSTVSDSARYCGFGPTGNHCIGIGYIVRPDRMNLHLSAPRPTNQELFAFADSLRDALGVLHDLLATADL
jgi:carnitine O-acetyltransferase